MPPKCVVWSMWESCLTVCSVCPNIPCTILLQYLHMHILTIVYMHASCSPIHAPTHPHTHTHTHTPTHSPSPHTHTHTHTQHTHTTHIHTTNTGTPLLNLLQLCRSIARTAQLTPEQIAEAARTTVVALDQEKELKLAKTVIRFPEVICRILEDLSPHVLCDYLYDLCTTFSEFYDNCYCIEKKRGSDEIEKIHMSRILLCEATALVLEKGFHILGLQPVHKM